MYIPVSQRKQVGQIPTIGSATSGRYVPVAQRSISAPVDYAALRTQATEFFNRNKPNLFQFSRFEEPIIKAPIRQIKTTTPKVSDITMKDVGKAVLGGLGAVGKLAGTALQYIARSGAAVTLTTIGKDELPGAKGPSLTWEQDLQKLIFGEGPVKSIQDLIAEKEITLPRGEELPFGIKAPAWLAGPGIFAVIGLDFTGAGGYIKAIRAMAKTDDVFKIAKTLRQIGVADDLIMPTARKIATITDQKLIKNAIDRINQIQKNTKFIQEGTEQLVSKPGKYIPVKSRPTAPTIKKAKPIIQATKEVTPKVTKLTTTQRKFLSTTKSRIQKGVERVLRTTKTAEKRRVKAIEGRATIRGKLVKVKEAGKAKLKGLTDKLRIVKEKTIRKEELKGFKSLIIERSQWKNITAKITTKATSIKSIKKDIFDFAKKVLPKEVSGKLLSSVAKAETRGDLSRALRMIINERNKIIRKELTTNLSKIVKDIEKLPLGWQDKIIHEIDKVAFKGMTKKTVEKLTKLREFLSKQPEAVLLFGRKTLKRVDELKRLDKQNIADMSLRDLIRLNTKIDYLSKQGKLAKKVIAETEQLRQEALIKKLQITSKNIDKEIPRTIGVKLTRKQKLVNPKYQIAEQMNNGYMNYVSADIGFEILDNNVRMGTNMRTFKIPFDDAYFNYKEMNAGVVDNYFNFKKGLEKKYGKFENYNMERIMIHATMMQKGGRQKLIKSGIDKLLSKGTTVDNMVLAKAENELYQFMRNVNDELYPHIDKTLRSAHNRKLGKVDNYFSWQTDFNNSDEVFKRLEGDYILSSRTQQGFTKQRTVVGRQVLKLNAEDVFLKHVNDSTYFINTEDVLNNLGKIARDDGYSIAVGKNGQRWTTGWIDLQARKNIPAGYKPTIITPLLNNIGAGILGFRLSPVVKQPIAKITSAALLGKHTFKYDPQFFRHNLAPYVKKISKQQKFRTFDDPAYTELAKNKKLAKWQEMGYQAIKWVDGYTADSVWFASYRRYFADNNLKFNLSDFKKGISNKRAVEYADLITRRSQGGGEAKDLARMLVSGKREFFRSVLKFQTFILNESYLIPHDAIGVAIRTEKDYPKAIGIIMAYVASGVAEDYVTSGISQLFSPEKWAEKEREKKFINRIFEGIITKTPFINNIYSIYKYDSTGTVITDMPKNAVSGGKSLIQGKKPSTKIKGLTRLIDSIGQSIGIAGISQFGQIFRKFGIPEEKKKLQTPSEWRKSQSSGTAQTPSEWLKANQ